MTFPSRIRRPVSIRCAPSPSAASTSTTSTTSRRIGFGLGLKLAQVALSYGADDLHGTIIEEHIFHMAGATSPQLQTEADMIKAIREAGRTPVQRNTFYEPIKVLAESLPAANQGDEAKNSARSKVLEDNLATA